MKCILIVLDGLGDRGHPCLDGMTPLQAARTPNLDRLATLGMNGLYHPCLQGMALPSELAHFLIFGYDMEEIPGRGYLEAVGDGITVEPGEVAVLARLFSVTAGDSGLIIQSESPDIEEDDAFQLQQAIEPLTEGPFKLEMIPRRGIEGILMLRGGLSSGITDSNPIYTGRPLMKVVPLASAADQDGARKTADLVNDFLRQSYRTLSDHPINTERSGRGLLPVNSLATQRAGTRRDLDTFRRRWGMRGLSLSSGSMYRGMCAVLGLENHQFKKTGEIGSDLLEQLKLAAASDEFDFIHVHTKAPDEAAHTKDPFLKKETIEELDRALSFAVEEIAGDPDTLLVITADHSTGSAGDMIHSGETVPITMIGRNTRRDDVTAFNEISCAGGGLGVIRGKELMYLILNFRDRGKLWGLTESSRDEPYFPGDYEVLDI